MIPKMTTESTGIAATKMSAAWTLMVNAIIIAPKTTNGERSSRRSVRLTPFWIWFISLVILVMSVEVPIWSISDQERLSMWRKSSCFTFEENPTAAFAAKYCAVIENASPTMPSPISRATIPTT